MPVRDRFQELMLHRKRSTWGSFKAASRPMAKKDKNIASILQLARDTQVSIDKYSKAVDELRKVYSDIIASPFMENKQLGRLAELNSDLSDISHKIQIQLDSINPKKSKKLKEVEENNAENRVRLNQHRTLNSRFKFITSVRRQAKLDFEEKGRQRIKRQLSILGKSKSVSEETIDVVVNKCNFVYFNQDVITDEGPSLTEVNNCLKQEQEVVNLESNILHLHAMFEDLKVAVNEQGEVINSIQHSMVKSVSYVEEGTHNIAHAKKYVKKFSKTKLLFVIILACSFVLGLLIIALITVYK